MYGVLQLKLLSFRVIIDMPPSPKKRNDQKQGLLEGSFSDPGDKL